tara:strand:+ start:2717 stop:4039 length:1323 start_codon:yes stop_codon:yes gene_type:complete
MNIAVIGTGYVGLVTGACFSEMGNTVVCIDNNQDKINKLNKGIVPIYEPGLKELIQNNSTKTLFFSTEIEKAVKKSDIIFIAVGTPMSADGSADLSSVYDVAKLIGENIASQTIVVTKSTVPVGTTFKIQEIIQSKLTNRNITVKFDVASNPEFLKEGSAIDDFMKPDRVVIGVSSDFVLQKMKELYSPFFRTHDRFITMDVRSAEMTKYAANAMLATKISFINEIANICEKVGADANQVRIGIGSDKRIGYSFIYPGIGYGGTCFPKDIAALKKISIDNGYDPVLISAVENVNYNQKKLFVNKVILRFGENLKGLIFTIWGLSFKPETDDMREAPSIYVIKELVKRGAKIKAFDPKAMKEAEEHYLKGLDNITYIESKYKALKNADAMILLTEWKEFRSPDFEEIKMQLKTPVIIDGRNQYKSLDLQEKGFEYYQVGRN